MNNQPTATSYIRHQESWYSHLIDKTEARIEELEESLLEDGWTVDELSGNEELMALEEDVIFYIRFVEVMKEQREYIRGKYLGGNQ